MIVMSSRRKALLVVVVAFAVTLIVIVIYFVVSSTDTFLSDEARASYIDQTPPKTQLVVLGQVAQVGLAPRFFSGFVPAYQLVEYDVLERISGKPLGLLENKITVQFLVAGRPSPKDAPPRLNKESFYPGRIHVLYLARENTTFTSKKILLCQECK